MWQNAMRCTVKKGGFMSEEVEIKRVKFDKCPRCGSHNISHKRLNKDGKCAVICRDCTLGMISDSYSSLRDKWNKTKEERMTYVILLLKKLGNAYIGAIDKTIWSDDNLEQYLTEQVGKEVLIRNPVEDEEDHGIIAEVIK